jgi:3-hydroxybutyryl-CoA dehydrogenase
MVDFPVVLVDVDLETATAAHRRLIAESERCEQMGQSAPGSADQVRANIRPAASIGDAVEAADFIEEAVFEDPDLKHTVLREISRRARPDAIIGSNTSTIPVSVLASAVERPERFLTVHWSNPAQFIPGVELVVGEHTDRSILPLVRAMLMRAGRQSALVADVPGFVLNRLQYVLLKEACSIVEEGVATVGDVDTIVRSTFGFRLPFFGPFEIADMAGLDVYSNGFRILSETFGERLAAPKMLEEAVRAGKLGLKNGAGLTGEFGPRRAAKYVDYRATAYGRLTDLLTELGNPDASAPKT